MSCDISVQDWKMGQALGCYQVDQSNVAIKEQFGRFVDVLEPGCHCLPWCLGYQIAGGLSLRVQQLDVKCETKTKVLDWFFLYYAYSSSCCYYLDCLLLTWNKKVFWF